jgi:hypothetical protein
MFHLHTGDNLYSLECFRYVSAVLPITNFLKTVCITDINSFSASFQNCNHNLGMYFRILSCKGFICVIHECMPLLQIVAR